MTYFNANQEAAINSGILEMHNYFASKNVFHAIKRGTITSITESNNHNAFYKNSIQNNYAKKRERPHYQASCTSGSDSPLPLRSDLFDE